MKRFQFWNLIVALLAMTMTVSLASCGDDDENEVVTGSNSSTTAVDSVKTYCKIQLADAYYQFFDITVTYTNASGELISDVALTKDTTITTVCNGTGNYSTYATCVIKATPKAEQPELEAETIYDMSRTIALYHYTYTGGSKTASSLSGSSSPSTQSAKGANLVNYIASEKTLYDGDTRKNQQ